MRSFICAWLVVVMPVVLLGMDNVVIDKAKWNLSDKEWQARLSAEAYKVLRKEGTERAGTSPLDKLYEEGTYVCTGCGLPLFESTMKYDSKTGWPSFFDVIPGRVETKKDYFLFYPRTEYHCAQCGGHQGHVFNDGPEPTGLRYCNNGVALKFIPKGGAVVPSEQNKQATASVILAGGCFWCMEPPFDKTEGVINTTVGYSGGHKENPTYKEVGRGGTGHLEVIKVDYDPSVVSFKALLEVFWVNIDPLDGKGQFCDQGESYQSAIFVSNEGERALAEESKVAIEKRLGKKVVTPILEAKRFYDAEDYHQNYYQENPLQYKYYRYRCGRDKRLSQLWGG